MLTWLRHFTRSFVKVRSYAPAVLSAALIALGQLLAWFLSAHQVLIVVIGGSLVCLLKPRGALRFALLGILLGLLSSLAPILMHVPASFNGDKSYLVRVVESPRRPRTGEVIFIAHDLLSTSASVLRCSAVELPWRHAAALREGSVVWIRARVTPVERQLNPFSWAASLWRRGISGECDVRFVSAPLEDTPPLVERLRARVIASVEKAVGDSRGAGVFLSMAFGVRDILSDPVERAFTSLGLKHLLVVSGYQVSLVFSVLTSIALFVMRRAPTFRHTRAAAMSLSFVGAFAFVACLGFELSALRALVAAGCICASSVFERAARFGQRWGVALLVLLILYPWAFFDVGVQLTFLALAGIGVGIRLGQGRAIATVLWVGVCAWLFTGVLLVALNGSVAPLGLPLNLILGAPWSFLNCVVGTFGLVLFGTFGARCSWVLEIVVSANELLAAFLIRLAAVMPGSTATAGPTRWGIVGFGVVLCVLIVNSAIRAQSFMPMRGRMRQVGM